MKLQFFKNNDVQWNPFLHDRVCICRIDFKWEIVGGNINNRLYDSEQCRRYCNMIRYILFAISFLVLFTVFQVLAGYVATLLYTPDIANAWKEAGHASSEVVITGSSRIISLILAFLAATFAYFLPNLFVKKSSI